MRTSFVRPIGMKKDPFTKRSIQTNPEFADLKPTPHSLYMNRRIFLQGSFYSALAATVGYSLMHPFSNSSPGVSKFHPWGQPLQASPSKSTSRIRSSRLNRKLSTSEKKTDPRIARSYVNFYEFSTDKEDPVDLARNMKTKGHEVEVILPGKKKEHFTLDDLLEKFPLQKRIYRHRCVEGWSMVIPWIGFGLKEFIDLVKPGPGAKYVVFESIADPSIMPNVKTDLLDWPYTEALRMDEATNILSFLAVGMYDRSLPPQNGSPLRLVVPWKYGFKSIKSIQRIRFADKRPTTTWMKSVPEAYGFYANVNPEVPHPNWSQQTERRIGNFLRQKTLMFNGYEKYVAHLYEGMDLRKDF